MIILKWAARIISIGVLIGVLTWCVISVIRCVIIVIRIGHFKELAMLFAIVFVLWVLLILATSR